MSSLGRPSLRRRALGALALGTVLAASLLAPAATLAVGGLPVPGLDTITLAEDGPPVTGNVLTNDTDPDGDPLSVTSVVGVSLGTLAIEPNGDFSFTPDPDEHGAESATYYVTDGVNEPVAGQVDITVTSVPDAPVAVDDTVTGTEDTVLTMTTLLDNDYDADGDTLRINWLTNQVGGTFSWLSGTSVRFTPPADVCGEAVASVDYQMNDGTGRSDMGHVTVDLTCVNDAPVAVDDEATAGEGGPAVDIDVLANDVDVDGPALAVTELGEVSPAGAGTAALTGGLVRFTPIAPFVGSATLEYTVSDGELADTGTLTITVLADEAAPVVSSLGATFGTGRVNESAPLRVSWAGADAGTGIATWQLQVSVAGGTYSTLYAGAATATVKSFALGKSLAFRVRAIDGAGNVSEWKTLTRSTAAYQAPGSASIRYRGTWTTVRNSRHSGVGARYTTTRGKLAKLTFTGREVIYVAPRTRSGGRVKVYVDGVYQGRFSLYSTSTKYGQIVFRKALAYGSHTIKVVNRSSGKRAWLDAFVVMR